MKKLIAILTFPLVLQGCGSMDFHADTHAYDQSAVIEAIGKEDEALALYLKMLQEKQQDEPGLAKSVFSLALAGAAYTNPISGMSSGMSMLVALGGMRTLNTDPEQPLTIIYQGNNGAQARSPFQTIEAYRQAVTELAAYDGSLAQAVMAKYADQLGITEFQAALAEGVSSPADMANMCQGLAAVGSQAESIYNSLKVPDNLRLPAQFMQNVVSEPRPLQASL